MKKLCKVSWFILCFIIGWSITTAVSAEEPNESICWIHVYNRTDTSTGTCFYIGDGFVLTNAHVAGMENGTINVHFGKYVTFGTLKASNPLVDLALVKTDVPRKINALPFAVNDIKTGDPVYTIGHPPPVFDFRMPGIVVGQYGGQWFTTAPGGGGLSGSPVFNSSGQVVGVHLGSANNDRLSTFVKIEDIQKFLEKEKKDGKDSDVQSVSHQGEEPRR